MGVTFCLLFTWWFVTGIVMMYWDYPEVTPADRLARAQPLDGTKINLSPQQAYASLDAGRPATAVQLVMFDGRAIYRFGFGRDGRRLVHADDGTEVVEFPPEQLLRVATAWTGLPARDARFEGTLTAEDQWTVSAQFRELRPLRKYSWTDGEEVYVSEVTGAVEQYTTRGERIGAYLGAIPHWLYFTPLRKNGRLWSWVVVIASSLATVAALFGLVVGIWMYSPSRGVPFRGQRRLHMILGLFFGIVACTWTFSGMLSMEPFPIEGDGEPYGSKIAAALRGKRPPLDAFSQRLPAQALAAAGLAVAELDLTSFGGEPVYLARDARQRSRIVPVKGSGAAAYDWKQVAQVVAGAVPVAEGRLLAEYDAYYLDRRRERPLPVVRVRLRDARNSLFYIDPRSARIVGRYASDSWISRWLYHGLHSINLPWLYRWRPAWDMVVLALMAGGTALSVTGVILAWHVLRRKFNIIPG